MVSKHYLYYILFFGAYLFRILYSNGLIKNEIFLTKCSQVACCPSLPADIFYIYQGKYYCFKRMASFHMSLNKSK